MSLQNEEEKAHEAFVRWQIVRIQQLGQTTNLVLGLSAASLGFGLNLLVSRHITSTLCASACGLTGVQLLLFSLIVLFIAIGLGLATNLTRLYDFRYTAKAARAREQVAKAQRQGKPAECPIDYGEKADRLGKWTWGLLWTQLATFTLGILLLAWAVWVNWKTPGG